MSGAWVVPHERIHDFDGRRHDGTMGGANVSNVPTVRMERKRDMMIMYLLVMAMELVVFESLCAFCLCL